MEELSPTPRQAEYTAPHEEVLTESHISNCSGKEAHKIGMNSLLMNIINRI